MWASSAESIANGKISILACTECILSFVLFWFIAASNPWPALTLVAFLATPLLLLRSKSSVRFGASIFRGLWTNDELINTAQTTLVCVVCALMSGLIANFLAHSGYFFRNSHGYLTLVAYVGICVGSVLAAAFFAAYGAHAVGESVPRFAAAETKTGFVFIALGVAVFTSLAGALVEANFAGLLLSKLWFPWASASPWLDWLIWLCLVGALLAATASFWAERHDINVVVLIAFGFLAIIGMLAFFVVSAVLTFFAILPSGVTFFVCMAVCLTSIRFVATLRYANIGLSRFSHNWRETTLCVDMMTPPEVLPGAKSIDPIFSAASFTEVLALFESPVGAIRVLAIRLPLLVVIWVLATAYRFNIKANAWLWGAIALAVSPTVWLVDSGTLSEERMRERTGFWTTFPLIAAAVAVWMHIVGAVLLPWIPPDVSAVFPKSVQLVAKYVIPPQWTVRYLVFVVLVVLLALLLLLAYRVRASHSKPLEGAGDYDSYRRIKKLVLATRGKVLRRWLKVFAACLIAGAWVTAVWLAATSYPAKFPYLAWQWLLPYM